MNDLNPQLQSRSLGRLQPASCSAVVGEDKKKQKTTPSQLKIWWKQSQSAQNKPPRNMMVQVLQQRTLPFSHVAHERQADSLCTKLVAGSARTYLGECMKKFLSPPTMPRNHARLMKKHLDTLWKNNYGSSFFFPFNLAVYQHLLVGATDDGERTLNSLPRRKGSREKPAPPRPARLAAVVWETLCSSLQRMMSRVLHCRLVLSTRGISDH